MYSYVCNIIIFCLYKTYRNVAKLLYSGWYHQLMVKQKMNFWRPYQQTSSNWMSGCWRSRQDAEETIVKMASDERRFQGLAGKVRGNVGCICDSWSVTQSIKANDNLAKRMCLDPKNWKDQFYILFCKPMGLHFLQCTEWSKCRGAALRICVNQRLQTPMAKGSSQVRWDCGLLSNLKLCVCIVVLFMMVLMM